MDPHLYGIYKICGIDLDERLVARTIEEDKASTSVGELGAL